MTKDKVREILGDSCSEIRGCYKDSPNHPSCTIDGKCKKLRGNDPCPQWSCRDCCVEAIMAALKAEESVAATHNSGITAKAQTAVTLMNRLYSHWHSENEWSGFAADVMREWEQSCFEVTAAS